MRELCEWVEIQPQVTELLVDFDRTFDYGTVERELEGLFVPGDRKEILESLKNKLMPDEQGMKMLGCTIHCLNKSWELYEEKGIPERIFVDTMKIFQRFAKEHQESYGVYGFDREWWSFRQLSLVLFRIGELEYEMTESEGKRVISIHIPSDAVLTPDNWKRSYEQADAFFRRYYPDWAGCPYICNSWLLSPALKELLGQESHILKFQSGFRVISWDEESREYLQWVFKRRDLPLEQLPENTSLQRNMKKYVLEGKKIGEAYGVWQLPSDTHS